MSLSSLKRFLPVAPPRHVVLLSDGMFFVRAVPVTEGATSADVAAQAELAIEALSPFPLAQLYYGHVWRPGAAHVLVYSAYRKRFTSEEVETWADAEVVLPAFTTALDKDHVPGPATAWVLSGERSLTALYFSDGSGVPAQMRVHPLSPESTDDERSTAREALLAAFPEKAQIIDVNGEPAFDPLSPQGAFVFRTGDRETRFEAAEIAPLDVRDKGELAARRKAHARDVILWRTFVGAAAAIALAALLEVMLFGASVWQNRRLAKVERQRPVVASIETSQALATRIEELSTKRLRPFEMLAVVNSARPRTIQFIRTQTTGLNTLEAEAQTNASGDIDAFRAALNGLAQTEKAEVLDPRSRDGLSTFRLVVTFKPDAFRASEEPPAKDSPNESEPEQTKAEGQT